MNRLITTGIAMLTLAFCACSGEDAKEPIGCIEPPAVPVVVVTPPPTPSAPLSQISKECIEAANDFALNFYKASSKDGNENVCISPLSISSVLSMIANGDDGASRDEVLSLLGFKSGEEGMAELNTYNKIIISNLPNLDKTTTCTFTNSLWHDAQLNILPEFGETISKYFYACEINCSPAGETGQKLINDFVEANTYGMIKNFLDSPLDVSMAFLNTTYFKGEWETTFDKDLTREEDFLNIDYSVAKTEFMCGTVDVEYAEADDGTKAVRMPYRGGHFNMTLILPSDQINHVPLNEALAGDNLKQLEESFESKAMLVSLPKFEVTGKNNETIDILKSMGLDKACDPEYGFPLIADIPHYLSVFIHAAKIVVDEKGTEAAAASLGGMDESAGPDPQIDKIVFDRPFIFMIKEATTGIILFMGTIKQFS